MKKNVLISFLSLFSLCALASGTYIVPPPQPKTELNCALKINQDKKQCQRKKQ